MKKNDAFIAFESYCTTYHLRATKPRISAFNIVQNASKPITAYDVLERMGHDMKSPKPPTAYRALDFLVEHGFIHRIESLNAYILCHTDHKHKGSQFMICDICGNVEEVHLCSLPKDFDKKVASEHFEVDYWNIEIHGRCKKCQSCDG